MKNWKTTAAGMIGAALTVALEAYQSGTVDLKTIGIAAVMAAIGYLAKDKQAAGGTVVQ